MRFTPGRLKRAAAVLAGLAALAPRLDATFADPTPRLDATFADPTPRLDATFHGGPPRPLNAALSPTPTSNQSAWDALFYHLDLNLDPYARLLTGTVTVRARVLEGPLTTLELDLNSPMHVSATRSAAVTTPFTHPVDLLTVTLDRPYQAGEIVEVAVDYNGTPYGRWFNFDSHAGQPLIWTLSEAWGARSWWPCKDAPEDKADSVEVRVAVPSSLIVASNGRRVESSLIGGLAVTRWQERHPITTYLVSVTAYPYTTYSDWWRWSPADSMELQYYMYPDQLATTTPANAMVPGMLDVYSSLFGPYPFRDEKYGHAQFPVGGGMEHQTIGSIGAFTESVVAHELAHQWWGDMVTCRDFRHYWLNEGFATYAEGLWYETRGGSAALREDLSYNVYFGPGTVYIPNLDLIDSSLEFDIYYNRASWVLHALRHVLGDAGFFASLAAYRAAHIYGTATTDEFKTACEGATGRDLNRFFDDWVYGERYPEYRYDWSAYPGPGGYAITLTIEQRQPWHLFALPIDVRVETAAGPVSFVVNDSLATQVFTLTTSSVPQSVALDPDDWILKTCERPVVAPAFDRGTLVVNGVSWDSAGSDIRSAYEARAFWGDYPIAFWDVFPAPAGGYPATLPAPLGHGVPTREILGRYRNVIWVSDHQGGDLSVWLQSPVVSYLETGGNLVLLTRLGSQYVHERLRDYLGIRWAYGDRIHDCIAVWTGLTNLNRLASMSSCSMFDPALDRVDSRLIYKVDYGYDPDLGIGVWRQPAGGGTFRPAGGQFVFLSGRPQYWVPSDLRANITTILRDFFGEPSGSSGVPGGRPYGVVRVGLAWPNPFQAATRIDLELPAPGPVEAVVVDVAGRRIRQLADGTFEAGLTPLEWNGRNDRGVRVASGVYWLRLTAGGRTVFRRVVLAS